MKILGIDFEPINTPIHRHVEAISATISFTCMTALFMIGHALNLYLLFFTSFWPISLAYFAWIWLDHPTTEHGGRRFDSVRSWKLFKYAADYYPIKLTTVPNIKLDPKRNYMFCGFPHAIFPNGLTIALLTKACGVDELFPEHTVYAGTLDVNLKAPLYRDFLMALGFCSVSLKSINNILEYPYGGKILTLIIGGAAETYFSHPGQYKIVLKNRKGFIKVAIKNGTPLVPMYGFGEVEVFSQYISPDGSWLQKIQLWLKDTTSIAFPIFYGRGLFQKTFGWVPYRKPLNVVVGQPIDVVKNENPSNEEIQHLHQMFIDELTKLFEEYKHQYLEDPSNKKLILV